MLGSSPPQDETGHSRALWNRSGEDEKRRETETEKEESVHTP